MSNPIIISYKLTTCQLLYLTNTYKSREMPLTIMRMEEIKSNLSKWPNPDGRINKKLNG